MADFARLPQKLPPQPADTLLGGLACRVVGDLAPMLCVELEVGQMALVNAEAMLWKEAGVVLSQHHGGVAQAEGPGRCGLGHGFAGVLFPMPLAMGEAVDVRCGHFLLSVGAEMVRDTIQDLGDRLSGGAGIAIDRFTAGPGGAVVWVQARGDMFERGLIQGEPFDIHHGAWLCKDAAVAVQAIFPSPDDDDGGRVELACLRFVGRGRVGFQSVIDGAADTPQALAARPAGGLRAAAGSLLGRRPA